jgi:alkylation response protein AidB-like acyl-CoA dehydrogenase
MTYELPPELIAAQAHARTLAAAEVRPRAAPIDRDATIPDAVAREAGALVESGDPLALVVTVEELAVASGAVALAAGCPAKAAPPLGLAGLRGAAMVDDSPRAQLVLAAVALGLGRAALESALEGLKQATTNRGTHSDAPHWVVADVATELDGARLLIYKAARSAGREHSEADTAMARLMASTAAARAVDAALRIAGRQGYEPGTVLERLARDVRSLSVLLGTEERLRAQAAEGLLPQ